MYTYSNPNSWNDQQICCDIGSISKTCYAPCETMFTICLRTGNTSHTDDSCPWSNHIKNSGIVSGGDNLTFTDSVGTLSNPIVFEGNSIPQVKKKLVKIKIPIISVLRLEYKYISK